MNEKDYCIILGGVGFVFFAISGASIITVATNYGMVWPLWILGTICGISVSLPFVAINIYQRGLCDQYQK